MSHQQVFLFLLSRNATGLDQDYAPGLLQMNALSSLRLQMQPSALSVCPSAWKQRSTCSSRRARHPHACCTCPSPAPVCAERPLPATPAVGPLSSKSTVLSQRQLLRCLTPALTLHCSAAGQPYLFDTVFKSTTVMQNSHRLWSWPAQ